MKLLNNAVRLHPIAEKGEPSVNSELFTILQQARVTRIYAISVWLLDFLRPPDIVASGRANFNVSFVLSGGRFFF